METPFPPYREPPSRSSTASYAPVPSYDGLGGELWELVRRCAEAGVDPEAELRAVARAYRDHIQAHEAPLP